MNRSGDGPFSNLSAIVLAVATISTIIGLIMIIKSMFDGDTVSVANFINGEIQSAIAVIFILAVIGLFASVAVNIKSR